MSITASDYKENSIRFQRDRLMDLIGNPPGWILHSGMIIISIMLCILVFLAWFIRFPDVISAPVVIYSSSPPIKIYANHSGTVDSIYVESGDTVVPNQILMYIANPALLEDVSNWSEWVEQLISSTDPTEFIMAPQINLKLGHLNNLYTGINQKYFEWLRILQDRTPGEKIRIHQAEIENINQLVQSIDKQVSIFDNELSLQKKNVIRDEKLLREGVLSEVDFEKSQYTFLVSTRQKESFTALTLNHMITIEQLEHQIIEAKLLHTNLINQAFIALQQMAVEAKASIVQWRQEFVLESKIDGQVIIPSVFKKHNYITEGDNLFSIIPISSAVSSIARARLSNEGLGKVKKGDRVLISLDAWPSKQYGKILTQVDLISPISLPNEEHQIFELIMEVSVPPVTTMQISLPLKPEESGNGRIITENRRILSRILQQFIQS